MLELRGIGKQVEGQWHIKDVSLKLEQGSLNVLLGPTLAGKTTLMRIMAGLDRPNTGQVLFAGRDVTGVVVQRRNVAMVYQQFINYQNLTVYENIASPLRIAGVNEGTIDQQVREVAKLLRLTEFLDRKPGSLSGGQQQRTALARAVVKKASLVLLDEPLANLDYKLREELREELPKIFAQSGTILVYATTEPSEALLLGGNTAVLSEGRTVQFGPTAEVFRQPVGIVAAKTFSDPPLNTVAAVKTGDEFAIEGHDNIPVSAAYTEIADGSYTLGLRAHNLTIAAASEAAVKLNGQVSVTELTGSESYVHIEWGNEQWVMLAPGVHNFDGGTNLEFFIDPAKMLVFDSDGHTVAASS